MMMSLIKCCKLPAVFKNLLSMRCAVTPHQIKAMESEAMQSHDH